MKNCALINRTVRRSGLDTDDEGHRVPVRRGRLHNVSRQRRGPIGERLEHPLGGPVHVVDSCLNRAVLVNGRAELLTGDQSEVMRLAHERLLMGTGDHGTTGRVVGKGYTRYWIAYPLPISDTNGHDVLTVSQAIDETEQAMPCRIGSEDPGHIGPVHVDDDVL